MSRFTFTYHDEENNTETERSFEVATWYEVLDQFAIFLRGCGYSLRDNSLGINVAAGHLMVPYLGNVTTFEQE